MTGQRRGSTPAGTGLQEAHDLAVSLAHQAGALQMRARAGVTVRAAKAHHTDPVFDVDLAGEAFIVDGLRTALPASPRTG